MTLRNSKLILIKKELAIDTIIYEYDNIIPEGYITFQLPKQGTQIKSTKKITLGVSKGVPPNYYIVPDVVNLSLDRAQNKIRLNGLRVGTILYEYQPSLLNNTVIDQSMTAGMRVSFPAAVNFIVSSNKE